MGHSAKGTEMTLGQKLLLETLAGHIALLEDNDLVVVTQAARSLGEIGRVEAGEALTATIKRTLPLAGATAHARLCQDLICLSVRGLREALGVQLTAPGDA